MNLLEKLERALVLAKEIGLSDQQTRELMSVVLDLPITKVTLQSSPSIMVPWTQPLPVMLPSPWPYGPGDTILTCGPLGTTSISTAPSGLQSFNGNRT